MPFQFQLRTLLAIMASVAVGLVWYRGLDPAGYGLHGLIAWWPGWIGLAVGFGFGGSLLISKPEPQLAAEMFVMSWLLMCINIADSGYQILFHYSSSDHQLPRPEMAVEQTLGILRWCLTPLVVLLPLMALRRELLQRVFHSRIIRLFFLLTLCDSVLLVLMIRYLITRTPLM